MERKDRMIPGRRRRKQGEVLEQSRGAEAQHTTRGWLALEQGRFLAARLKRPVVGRCGGSLSMASLSH